MAFTCVVLDASHTIKKSADASGIFRRSRLTIFSPFLSCIALIIVLKIFELRESLVIMLFSRVCKTERGSNNRSDLNEIIFSWPAGTYTKYIFFICICKNRDCWTNFVKNSNSLPPSTAKSTIGQPFIELTVVESTNIYAMEQLQANLAAHGTTFFAHNQTAGKGQHGKTWTAEPDTHIAMTVVLDCSFLSVSQQFRLSVVTALATHDLFSRYAGEETFVKWPNDIYWRDRKAGGILIETLIRGNIWQSSVVGIGVNLNQLHFPPTLANAISLTQITGKQFNTVVLAKELCIYMEKRYHQLKNGEFESLLMEYNEHLYKRGQEVKLKKNNIAFNCRIIGVSALGELVVAGGLQDSFSFGEVEWILPNTPGNIIA